MNKDILASLNQHRTARRAVMVINNFDAGEADLITQNEIDEYATSRELSNHIRATFLDGKSRLVEDNQSEYFLNIYLPPTRLVVIGAVHISQCLATIAKVANYDLEIIDPRTAFATPERFKDIKMSIDWPQNVLEKYPLDPYCALIAVTHDPKIDDHAICSALEAGCFYVGALGSRRTHAKRLQRLEDSGVKKHQSAKIFAPIGMDIGAANPAEIAVAIMGQVIDRFRRRGLNV